MTLKSTLGAMLIALTGTGSALAADIDLQTPQGALQAMRKIHCSLVDGEPVTYYWKGRVFARRQGERDKHVFDVQGMNVRTCSKISDPKKGDGYRLVSREILLYVDKNTGEILRTWDNPWTGASNDVLHVANDPVSMSVYTTGRDGKPTKFGGDVLGDKWQLSFTIPLFYPNPLGSRYQQEIGGTYHASEMFNFFGDLDDLVDENKSGASVSIGWTRMSQWLPWMKMSGREGVLYMHTAGRRLESWNDLPDWFQKEIRDHYPKYVGPPPADDMRRNITSWQYYKGVAEGTITAPERD